MVLETKHFDVVITRGGPHDGFGSTSQAALCRFFGDADNYPRNHNTTISVAA
jgi:hypothetical protein